MAYQKLKGISTVIIKKEGFMRLKCCDCGLVHNIVNTGKKSIALTFSRDNRRTGQARRYKKEPLLQHIDLMQKRLRQSSFILRNIAKKHPELFPLNSGRGSQVEKNEKAIEGKME